MANISAKPKHCWSELPTELLQLILKKIDPAVVDIFQFKAVCSLWKMAANSYKFYSPWILCRGDDNDNDNNEDGDYENETAALSCRFFNLVEKKTYKIKNVFEDKSDYVVGTSYGWLVISNHSGKKLTLSNPFSRAKIELPTLTINSTTSATCISKAIVLSKPSLTKSFKVIVSFNYPPNRLAMYMHIGNKCTSKWTEFGDIQSYKDLICHNNMLYSLKSKGFVEVWQFRNYTSFPKKVMTVDCPYSFLPKIEYIGNHPYSMDFCGLVESLDEVLLIVARRNDDDDDELFENDQYFYVFELDCFGKTWEKVENLRDRVLFLSGNLQPTIHISAKSSSECEGNSIYFLCDFKFFGIGSENIEYGVYNLEEKVVKSIKQCNIRKGHFTYTPLWMVPN